MNPKSKVNVTVNPSPDGKPVTLLIGEPATPLPLKERKNVLIVSTSIDGPSKFWANKQSLYKEVNSHVLFDKVNGKILLVCMESDLTQRDEVSGVLTANPQLVSMKINTESEVGHTEMLKKLRWARNLFPDRKEYEKLISSFMNFKAQIETAIEKSNDNTGNITESLVIKTKQEIPLIFNLKTNLFIGQPEETFDVQITVTPRGNQLVFGLESLTLFEKQGDTISKVIDAELVKMTKLTAIEAKL